MVLSLSVQAVAIESSSPPEPSRPMVLHEKAFDTEGNRSSSFLIITIPGRPPVRVEHDLDLPEFRNPEMYESDIARYTQNAHILKMLEIGLESKVIRNVPSNLKGEKFREWLQSSTTRVENSICSNAIVRKRIMNLPAPRGGDLRGIL